MTTTTINTDYVRKAAVPSNDDILAYMRGANLIIFASSRAVQDYYLQGFGHALRSSDIYSREVKQAAKRMARAVELSDRYTRHCAPTEQDLDDIDALGDAYNDILAEHVGKIESICTAAYGDLAGKAATAAALATAARTLTEIADKYIRSLLLRPTRKADLTSDGVDAMAVAARELQIAVFKRVGVPLDKPADGLQDAALAYVNAMLNYDIDKINN